MRTIKFRGKRIDTLEWVYGFYLETQMSGVFILGSEIETKKRKDGITMRDKLWQHEVLPESVGQWTGLVDRHGKEIFEGDIVELYKVKGVVRHGRYEHSKCDEYPCTQYGFYVDVVTVAYPRDNTGFSLGDNYYPCQVVGNEVDNPELMEVE